MFRVPRLVPLSLVSEGFPALLEAWEEQNRQMGPNYSPPGIHGAWGPEAGWCRRTLPGSLEGLCGAARRSWELSGAGSRQDEES